MCSMFASPAMFSFRCSMARATVFIFDCPLTGVSFALADSLDEANRRTGEIKFVAQTVFKEALVAEMQFLALVRKQNERRRRSRRLCDVVNFHAVRGWRSAARKVDIGEPAIQFAGRNAP